MTTMNTENEYDPSQTAQKAISSMAGNGYVDHRSNGQGENGYHSGAHGSQTRNLFRTDYSQSGGNANGSSTGSKPEDERKLFVGGLTWDTTQDDLREYFSNFGTIHDCSIKLDPSTGRSRGFAFLVFDSKDIVETILSKNDHFVKGRKVDPKPAHRRLNATNNQANNNNNNNNILAQSSLYTANSSSAMPYVNANMATNLNPSSNNNRKVFIGGLDPSFPDSQLREYFSKFGKIDEIDLPYDKEKNERRPFCFISFQTEQAAQEVLRLQRHTIGHMSVDVKRAKPKTQTNQQQQQQLMHQQLYDPYGQQVAYANYGASVSSYGNNVAGYPTGDAYAHWNAYTYNQQANPAAYPYGNYGSSVSSPETSTYVQYSDHPTNPQYQYAHSNAVAASEGYPHYNYGTQQTTGFNMTGSGYDYPYYPPMNSGMSASINENGTGQQSENSPGNQPEYEYDNLHGKAKTSIVSSPTYHPYSRT